jgi:ATP-dependent exoDNAse (exonuclease V) beta subunit
VRDATSSFDFNAIGRQGWVPLLTRFPQWAKAVNKSVLASTSANSAKFFTEYQESTEFKKGLTRYLKGVPEHIDAALFEEGSRCSELKLSRNPGLYHAKNTPLNRLTEDARRLAVTNRDRHAAVEDYFIACDRNTIAVEIPVVCHIPEVGAIAGHIDILQMYRGGIYILDY